MKILFINRGMGFYRGRESGKENRKKIIENFNWEKSAEELKELYEQLF